MSTQTLTILFTDLANYTSSVHNSARNELRALITGHEKKVRDFLEQKNGSSVKNIGDSFLFVFHSATDAINAAMGLIDEISADQKMQVKIGIATGDVEDINGDYFGDAVNLASRIVGLAEPNEIWFSDSTFFSMKPAEIPYLEVGLQEIKGFSGKRRLFRAVSRTQVSIPEQVERAAASRSLMVLTPDDPPRLYSKQTILLVDFQTEEDLYRYIGRLRPEYIDSLWRIGDMIPPSVRYEWEDHGYGWIIGSREVVQGYLSELQEVTLFPESEAETFFFDKEPLALGTLGINGLALPRTPVDRIVKEYCYVLCSSGEWDTDHAQGVLEIRVSDQGVVMAALTSNVRHNEVVCPLKKEFLLGDGDVIQYSQEKITFSALASPEYAGYLLGKMLRKLPLLPKTAFQIGRSPSEGGLQLFNRKGQGHLHWCTSSRAVRAKENGYNLDRSLVGRQQVEVTVFEDGRRQVQQVHEKCSSFLVRDANLIPVTDRKEMRQHDILILGTNVISIEEFGR